MTTSVFEMTKATSTAAWSCTWVLTAPWAHPIWSQYVIALYDLSTDLGNPPKIYMEGATHEFLLFAIDPNYPLIPDVLLAEQKIMRLEPPNYGYQFGALSNEAARIRLQVIVNRIDNEHLSPDTDLRTAWDSLFKDAYALVH